MFRANSGGGVGGLTCAIALSKYRDIEVTIYESAAKLTELGAGVGIWPRPWRVLEALGVGDDLLKMTEIKHTTELSMDFFERGSRDFLSPMTSPNVPLQEE
jgi:salicylate hydroxylase